MGEPTMSLFNIVCSVQPLILHELQQHYASDPVGKQLASKFGTTNAPLAFSFLLENVKTWVQECSDNTNMVADFLSCKGEPTMSLFNIVCSVQPLILHELQQHYASDPVGKQLASKFGTTNAPLAFSFLLEVSPLYIASEVHIHYNPPQPQIHQSILVLQRNSGVVCEN
ncbi:unnamed protein product [Vicia faba]|uniref:Uncharacterized protein n=1 Tax=Vicia faba TaxID=3906 RepID=A0AAV1AEK7_VICFA|nr:unnamed protein product [Vicia faba]